MFNLTKYFGWVDSSIKLAAEKLLKCFEFKIIPKYDVTTFIRPNLLSSIENIVFTTRTSIAKNIITV